MTEQISKYNNFLKVIKGKGTNIRTCNNVTLEEEVVKPWEQLVFSQVAAWVLNDYVCVPFAFAGEEGEERTAGFFRLLDL